MPDNTTITPGTGATVAADDIGGVLYQRVKLAVGADGSAADLAPGTATAANSLPVAMASDGTFATLSGAVTETAPASDTASSGLNGRLQRIAQRLTTLLAVFPTTIDTNSGNKSASTLRVVLATDQPANTNPLLIKASRSATPTQSSVAGAATTTSLLASNSARLGATIYNDSTAILYLKLGATASTTSYTAQLAAGAYYEVPFQYTGAIDGIWASATGNARITELA